MELKITRRKLLQAAAMSGAAMVLPIRWFGRGTAYAYAQSPLKLRKFVAPLPGLGPTGIPAASPITQVDSLTGLLTDFYTVSAGQFRQQLHPDLPGDSKLWGYADVTNGQAPNRRYLGGAIVATKGRPVKLTVKNELPDKHPLPVDKTIMGAEPQFQENRITVHLHGGLVPWNSDGGPHSWFDPRGNKGESFQNPGVHPNEAAYYYPNDQSARLAWYHDHALGITRLNAYAGLATAYIIRDDFEAALISKNLIPSGAYEVPLIIQEKTFVDGTDPNYTWGKKGDLWYPYKYEPGSELPLGAGRWDYGPDQDPIGTVIGPLPIPSVVPEFFGDTTLVNGMGYPFLNVEQRHYRFRILNGCQARFLNLQLYYADSTGTEIPVKTDPSGNWLVPNLKKVKFGPRMIQIGTEGGFLPFPVALNNPPAPFTAALDQEGDLIPSTMTFNLLLAPAERADVIIDFSEIPAGSMLILYSDAPAPFPMGDPRNDYYTGDPDQADVGGAPATHSGKGPNTRTLMQFRVVPRTGPADPPSLRFLERLAVQGAHAASVATSLLLPKLERLESQFATRVRDLTLNEDFDELGRLVQNLGTTVSVNENTQGLPTFARGYDEPATETPNAGDTEIWRIFNLTGDTHPIHFHLVNVQVLWRATFDATTPDFKKIGHKRPPDANELGWKETVRMNPGEVTAVIAKFDLPKVRFHVPVSQRTGGYEYVWHCHILDHEEHDMMRPLIIKP